MTPTTAPAMPRLPAFEEEFIAGLKAIFEEKIVFNQLLGLKITSLQADRPATACPPLPLLPSLTSLPEFPEISRRGHRRRG